MNTTRFAPSPTGVMHIGNIRGAILPYLLAKKYGLKFLLRIDDTDTNRSRQEYIESIYSNLSWLGINYDYTFKQSDHYSIYEDVLKQCIENNIVYPVYDTDQELDELRRNLRMHKKSPAYKRNHANNNNSKEQVVYWRFDIGTQVIKFHDIIKGDIEIDLSTVSDPVICKPNKEFTYTFASIVDDINESVSYIVRGADHITNTAVQLGIIQRLVQHDLCKDPSIKFAHYPLFTEKSGQKFSKRNNSLSIDQLTKNFHPLTLLHYSTFLGSSIQNKVCNSIDQLAKEFNLQSYSASALIDFDESELFTWQKRIFIQSEYSAVKEFIESCGGDFSQTWHVLRESIINKRDVELWNQVIHQNNVAYSTIFGDSINKSELIGQNPSQIMSYLKSKGSNNLQFLRQALTGMNSGPKLNDLITIIPPETINFRLNNYHNTLLRFYNTIIRDKDRFHAIDSHKITMYGCGPTVYNNPHIGNIRSFLMFDLFYRLLSYFYKRVVYVRNITDIDDKIIDESNKQNISIAELTKNIYHQFQSDMSELNILNPTAEPKVTDNIDSIIITIQKLINNGFAYVINDDGVYFDIQKFRVNHNYDVFNCIGHNTIENNKDFVLWKFRHSHEIGWDSPWGKGRPGWHIECTAMSLEQLGIPFDLHFGGRDLIFPHHTNECAQAGGLGHNTVANYWIHVNFINIDEAKMSKSLKNYILYRDIDFHPMVIRLALVMTHYRHELPWSESVLIESSNLYNKWRRNIGKIINGRQKLGVAIADFIDALADDLNTPLAIRIIDQSISTIEESTVGDAIESLKLLGIEFDFGYLSDSKIIDLVDKRQIARKNKDFASADIIRDQLIELGVNIEEGKDTISWYQDINTRS